MKTCELRLAALDDFSKYFFAMYACALTLFAWHVAEICALEVQDPEPNTELKSVTFILIRMRFRHVL